MGGEIEGIGPPSRDLWRSADGYDAILARLGATEILLPSQVGGRWREIINEDPAHRLRFAVFLRAISDYRLRRPARFEVRQWLRTTEEPFTFGEICEAFGWEESWMRARLRRWMDAVDRGQASARFHRGPSGRGRSLTPKPRRVRR